MLGSGDMAAEIHLFQFYDIFQFLDTLVSCVEAFDHLFDLSFLLTDLIEELLLDCLESAVDLSHFVDFHLQLNYPMSGAS